MERERIDEWLNKSQDDFSNDVLKNIAERNSQTLDELPEDVAGQIKELESYEFLNPDAQRKFLELLEELRRAMTNTFFNNIENMVNNMSEGDIEMIERARSVGASAKFAGSGGAIVGTYEDDDAYGRLEQVFHGTGTVVLKPTIAA